MISSFARNWERSEPKNGKLGLTNGIDSRQNGIKFSKDCWKPSKAREDMGKRGPRHPLPTPVHPNVTEVRTTPPSLARTPDHSGPPPSIPIEGTRPRTTLVDSRKVSTPET